MRVGIVLHGPGAQPTGVPRSSVELLRALCSLPDGPQVHLLGNESLGEPDPPGLMRIPLPRTLTAVERPVRRAGRGLNHLTVVAGWLPTAARRHELDVVHDLTGLVPFPRRIPDTRVVATLHDLVSYRPSSTNSRADDLVQRRWLPFALRHVDAVVTVSETVAQEARATFRLSVPVIAVHHGIDHGELASVRPDVSTEPPAGDFLLAVGVTSERKNIAAVVRAARAGWVAGTLPPLLLAGPPGPVVDRVLALAASLGVSDHIRAIGYLSDRALEQHYARATALVYPSLDEGFGLPILEAMSAGTPVVTADRGATREVAGDAALLVNPLDDIALERALRAVTHDGALRDALVARGRQRAAGFTWRAAAERLTTTYRQLLP